MLDAG